VVGVVLVCSVSTTDNTNASFYFYFFAFDRWSLVVCLLVVCLFTCCFLFVVRCSLFIVRCLLFVVRSVHQFDASGIVTQRTIDEDGRW
jgi:hypothetical protein